MWNFNILEENVHGEKKSVAAEKYDEFLISNSYKPLYVRFWCCINKRKYDNHKEKTFYGLNLLYKKY